MEDTDAHVLGVLQAVLELKDWEKASKIMDVLEAHGINACFHGGVRKALINLIHHLIEPVYALVTPKTKLRLLPPNKQSSNGDESDSVVSPNATAQIAQMAGLDEILLPIIKRLDLHIAHDVLVIVKILRLFKVRCA